MANPPITDIGSENTVLKTRYPTKRRAVRTGIPKARGFERKTVRGRIPITRPVRR